MARKERYLVGLDVGTSKVTAVVGEVLEGKGRDRSTFVVLDGVPLFFKARDGPSLPTLRLLCVCARNRHCARRRA